VHVALEEGGDEQRLGLGREFCLLCMYRDVGKALFEILNEYKAGNRMLLGECRKQSKTSQTGPIKSAVLLLGCGKGPGDALAAILDILPSEDTWMHELHQCGHSLPMPWKGAGASLALEGSAEK